MKPTENAYFAEGIAQFEAEDYAGAVESFTKALRLSLGDLAQILLYRGEAYAYLGAYERAFADFEAAIQHNAYLVEAYNERGRLHRLQGKNDAALQDFTKALQLDPDFAEAYYNRAVLYEELRQYQAAIDDFSSALTLNTGIAQAYEARARCRANVGDYLAAIDDLTRYLRMGGGRQYDNHSETQSYIITLRLRYWLRRIFRLGR